MCVLFVVLSTVTKCLHLFHVITLHEYPNAFDGIDSPSSGSTDCCLLKVLTQLPFLALTLNCARSEKCQCYKHRLCHNRQMWRASINSRAYVLPEDEEFEYWWSVITKKCKKLVNVLSVTDHEYYRWARILNVFCYNTYFELFCKSVLTWKSTTPFRQVEPKYRA